MTTTGTSRELRTDVVRYHERLGRFLRQDPPLQLGVPTQDLAVLAMDRGETENAVTLARYMVQEYKTLHDTVLNGWLRQLIEYAVDRLQGQKLELMLRVPKKHVWDAFYQVGTVFSEDAIRAIEAGEKEQAAVLLDHVRRVFKTLNDEVVRFIQDIFTALDNEYGEEEPIKAQRRPYETIWRERYAKWEELTPEEQLQLSAEGMRAHYGGMTRRGEFEIIDDGDRYRMRFQLCATGGMMRRGDPETGEGPWVTTGVNRTPKPYTWGLTGVPWYCTHCNLYLEHWAAEDHGYPMRPVIYHPDNPEDPFSGPTTEWLVYKGRAATHAEDFERIGLEAPPDAPRGEGQ